LIADVVVFDVSKAELLFVASGVEEEQVVEETRDWSLVIAEQHFILLM